MAVHPLFEEAAFEPETILLMSGAYEAACTRLGPGQPAAVIETIAKRIIDAARRGERDVQALTAIALRGLHTQDDKT